MFPSCFHRVTGSIICGRRLSFGVVDPTFTPGNTYHGHGHCPPHDEFCTNDVGEITALYDLRDFNDDKFDAEQAINKRLKRVLQYLADPANVAGTTFTSDPALAG